MRLVCLRCDAVTEDAGPDAAGLCDCGGVRTPAEPEVLDGDALVDGLGLRRETAGLVDATGDTPLRELPATAGALDVASLAVKDEGANPTGSVRDRGVAAAVVAAEAAGHDEVVTAAAGDGGVALAAHGARAGLDATVFLPSRARFDAKAAVNVHGGDMTVVRGRLGDAREAADDAGGYDCSPVASPYHPGAVAVLGRELVERDGGPDHVVVPVADGTVYLGLDAALPADVGLHAVQPAGCAPVVRAAEAVSGGSGGDAGDGPQRHPDEVRVVDPDTVVGELEDPAPPAGPDAVEAIVARGAGAVAVEDDAALDTGVAVARRDGRLPSLAGAVALEGCTRLVDRFESDDAVAVVDPGFGRLDADGFRSRLMARGE